MDQTLEKIDVIILAGGRGTRLAPVVVDRPKVLAQIGDTPFIYLLLNQVASAGARRVVIATGYLGNMVENEVGSLFKGMEILYSREREVRGTAGALRMAIEISHTKQVLVVNGDSLSDFSIKEFVLRSLACEARAAILLNEDQNWPDVGSVMTNQRAEVTTFLEKGSDPDHDVKRLVNAGVYFFETNTIREMSKRIPYSLEREFFPELVGKGLYGFKLSKKFLDIGTTERYNWACQYFSSQVV